MFERIDLGAVKGHSRTSKKGRKYQVKPFHRKGEGGVPRVDSKNYKKIAKQFGISVGGDESGAYFAEMSTKYFNPVYSNTYNAPHKAVAELVRKKLRSRK